MKSYNEIANNVFNRRNEYNAKKAVQKKQQHKAVLTTLCCFFAVLLSIGIWKSGVVGQLTVKITDNNSSESQSSALNNSAISKIESNNNSAANNTSANKIIVNQLDTSITSDDIAAEYRYYEQLTNSEQKIVLDNFNKFVGISYNDFTAKFSDILTFKSFHLIYDYKDSDNLVEEYNPHDYVFNYQSDNNGTAVISLCSFEHPFRDYGLPCEELSEINGISVELFGHNQNTYIAQFTYNNVYYDIETTNINLNDLISIVSTIVT